MKLTLLSIMLFTLAPASAAEEPRRAVVLVGKPYSQYQEVTEAFVTEWKDAMKTDPVIVPLYKEHVDLAQPVRTNPAFVVALGEEPAVKAIQRPEGFQLVFTMVVRPRRLKSLRKASPYESRPLRGVSIEVPVEDKLTILLEFLPTLKRIGVLTRDRALRAEVETVRRACTRRDLQLVHTELSEMSELPRELDRLLSQVDLVWSMPDAEIFQPQLARHIIGKCASRNVPLVGLSSVFVRAGATLSFERDYHEVGALAARECFRPSSDTNDDMTVISPETIVVAINQRSSAVVGLTTDRRIPHVRVQKY